MLEMNICLYTPSNKRYPVLKRCKMAKYSNGLEDKLDLTDASIKVLEKRYLKKDDAGKPIETANDMFRRVAGYIAKGDLIYNKNADATKTSEKFYEMMSGLYFIPNSPTLMNAGRELGQLSACFVLPVEDSIESIFDSLKYTALIHKSGGGTGFSFSRLRPKNDSVKSTSGISSGPVSFIKVYNAATEEIKQGGTRRGANMGILRVDHPDIMEFITCKDIEGALNNFNLSVALTKKFMDALEKDEEYGLVNPRDKNVVQKLRAREVYDKIVEQAWKNGEPGIVFLDRINEYNPTPEMGEIESTNPCGEQPLLPYESCNLGAINLSRFVKNRDVDWKNLEDITNEAVHFLDNVIDMNKLPLEQIEKMTKANRKIGLGVMGWADMLIRLGMSYKSEDAYKLADKVMGFIKETALNKSYELVKERGPFPNFSRSIYKDGQLRRNATITTIAPTGTTGVIAGASQGIESLFRLAYLRNVKDSLGHDLVEVNQEFERIAKERGFWSDNLIKIIKEDGKSVGVEVNTDLIPKDLGEIFVTAHDLTPEEHIRMQAAFQKHTDNAVSKTINFRNSATKEDIRNTYELAYRLGCKGVTVYRDKSRKKQVLTASVQKKENLEEKTENGRIMRVNVKKPAFLKVLHARKYSIKTASGTLHLTISDELYEDKNGVRYWLPEEEFAGIKPIGAELSAKTAISGLKSSYIFQGENPPYINLIINLKSVRTGKQVNIGKNAVFSLDHAEGMALEYHLLSNGVIGYDKNDRLEQIVQKKDLKRIEFNPLDLRAKKYDIVEIEMRATGNIERGEYLCPDCGSENIEHKEGCDICIDCGYSHCG